MKLLTTALLSASAIAMISPAASAQSQDYQSCEESREGRQVAGAIIGGLLGAIIGNEIADDSNNNRHGAHRGSRRGGHHGYRGRHRYQHRDRGNAEEVGTIAGAGVGALIGAGIAGGEECDNRRNAPGNRYPGKPTVSEYNERRYQNGSYQDSYGYSDDYYADDSSSQLIGGQDYDQGARTYSATSSDWTCEWTNTRRLGEYGQAVTEQVYMCQGADGIWRPYDSYVTD
jgi:hypothetical protein